MLNHLALSIGVAATSELPLPNTAALVGTAVHHQTIVLDLTGAGAIAALTATDALSFAIGQS